MEVSRRLDTYVQSYLCKYVHIICTKQLTLAPHQIDMPRPLRETGYCYLMRYFEANLRWPCHSTTQREDEKEMIVDRVRHHVQIVCLCFVEDLLLTCKSSINSTTPCKCLHMICSSLLILLCRHVIADLPISVIISY